MALQEAEIRKVAKLAQLQVSDQEVAHLAVELNAIVAFVEQLAEVDVSGVEPVAQVSGIAGVSRADEAGAMLSLPEIFAGAPRHNEQAFLVPKAVTR